MCHATRIWIGLLILAASVLPAEEIERQQVWESADGREITATVLELDPGAQTVKLRRSDGFVFTIKFEQFSENDAERLRNAARQLKEVVEEPRADSETPAPAGKELPERFELDDVPMVRQKNNYCVPASAAMIAGFHGVDTDQDQIAFLSSAGSFNNQGTYPRDMFLAMKKLGFDGRVHYWKSADDFRKKILPGIRRALVEQGPVYISFKPGVFGDSGHGCIIIGYHDRQEELTFHNPWGNEFEREYNVVGKQAHGIVQIFAPKPAPIASDTFIARVREIIPQFDGDIATLPHALKRNQQKHELVWCSRRDARHDKHFAADTARDDGRKILDLAFHRNPAVILPASDRKGITEKYLFVTRPPEGGAQFMVREINGDGWSDPELVTLGSLTRGWPTRIENAGEGEIIWELPMIELHPGE